VQNKVTPGEIVIMVAGAVCLIFSFLPFFTLDIAGFDDDISAWGEGLFPVATLIVAFTVIAAVLVVLTKFANMTITGFLGFGLVQLLLALSFFAAILALAYLMVDKGEYDFGFGYWLVLLGSLASVVGAVLVMNERRAAGTGPGTGPPV
jgi:hypothetical protein